MTSPAPTSQGPTDAGVTRSARVLSIHVNSKGAA